MKSTGLFLLLIFLFVGNGYAQPGSDTTFNLKAIPNEGVVLDRGWLFYPGDDFSFGNGYATSNGIAINPTLHFDELPQVKQSRIGWFVLKMKVDATLRNKTIGFMLSLFGAAEIYLNGTMVCKLGNVSANYSQEKTQAIFGRILTLALNKNEEQILAVRFSHQPQNIYAESAVAPPCLRIVLQPLDTGFNKFILLVKRAFLFTGIGLTIELASALLTLFFFFSFRARKEYLYFGLYFSFNFLGLFVQSDPAGIGETVQVTVNQFSINSFLFYAFVITGSLFHLNGIYTLLHKKQTRYYRFLLAYGILSLGTLFFIPRRIICLPDLFFLLSCFEVLPLYYKAARKGFRGGWILFGSILLCFFFLLSLIAINNASDTGVVIVITACAMFTPALGIVIFLALDFARTSSSLKIRIVEVERLSQTALAQEREKQEFLAAQKEKLEAEVQHRTADLRKSLAELKATQAQLIQAEKMASLGELTAGIAHEIQNPLNFINNFSELSVELSNELKEEVAKSALNVEQKKALQNRIEELVRNHEKIMSHGSRADAIVKNMLQHSRKADGQKTDTDINALVNEYLRLSYHGLQAKQKDFSASVETDFDPAVGSVSVVPQDLGRVLINLFNNAFYAVQEKKKSVKGNFEPVVRVSTKRDGDQVHIVVRDNGMGMAEKTKEKIFQPFFTTKPAGQGTGLGLSLSYDIVTKGHGGELKVESEEGQGAAFIVSLPAIQQAF